MTPKETVEAIYSAFQRGDIPFILDQLAPDVFWRQPASVPWGGDSTGPEQVGTFFARLDDLVETTGLDVEDNIEAADEVISYGYYSSRNRLTGKVSRARFVFRWQFRTGKVARYEAVLDSAPIVAAEKREGISEQANVRLIQELYAAFGRGDVVAVLNSLDPQAELDFEGSKAIPWAGHWHGREGWAKFLQTLGENADEITLQMEPFAAQSDNVVTAGRYQARVKRTGERIDSPLVHLWSIRNGMVVRCQELTNTATEATACAAGAMAAG